MSIVFSDAFVFLHITAKIRLVMGSYFHQSFLLILSTTFYFGFFRHLENFSHIWPKMSQKLNFFLQNSTFMEKKLGHRGRSK